MAGTFELGTDGPSVIVVGLDGSPTSWRATAYAAGLARRQGARLVVVHVPVVPPTATMMSAAIGAVIETVRQAAAELRAEVERAAAGAGVPLDYREVEGDPLTVLCQVCDSERADAVVIGASTSAGHRLVGSLAVRLVRAARWPVTVVP